MALKAYGICLCRKIMLMPLLTLSLRDHNGNLRGQFLQEGAYTNQRVVVLQSKPLRTANAELTRRLRRFPTPKASNGFFYRCSTSLSETHPACFNGVCQMSIYGAHMCRCDMTCMLILGLLTQLAPLISQKTTYATLRTPRFCLREPLI